MDDSIANIILISQNGQKLSSHEEKELDDLFNNIVEEIRISADILSAQPHLDRLDSFQFDLARACFKWNVSLPARLRQLVREFDRPDDPEVRANVFRRIKDRKFCPTIDSAAP